MQVLSVAIAAWAIAAVALLIRNTGTRDPSTGREVAMILIRALPVVGLTRRLIGVPYLWEPVVLAYTLVLLGRPLRWT